MASEIPNPNNPPIMPEPETGDNVYGQDLEMLASLNKFIINGKVNYQKDDKDFSGYRNQYFVMNNSGQKVYFVGLKQCEKKCAMFEVFSNRDIEIMKFKCTFVLKNKCVCSDEFYDITVKSEMGGRPINSYGRLWQRGPPETKLALYNENKHLTMRIDGNWTARDRCLTLKSPEGNEMGSITGAEVGNNVDYHVSFPEDLNATLKAVLLGTIFLIDSIYILRIL